MASHAADLDARTNGYRPAEISALVLHRVVEEHAGEAAALRRNRAIVVRTPHVRLKHLARLDARLSAHLRGLEVADAAGWRHARRLLADANAGSVFVVAHLAFSAGDAGRMNEALQVALTAPELERGLVSALAWIDAARLVRPLEQLAASTGATHRAVALAVAGAHRIDPGTTLDVAVRDADPNVRARALRLAGDAHVERCAPWLAATAEHDDDPACRFWAARSAALLGDPYAAPRVLEAAATVGTLARHGREVALRCGNPAWARDIVRRLAEDPATLRAAIHGAGCFGDPAVVPWLLDHMTRPEHARVAGEAFATITGADLEYLDLDRDPPDDAPPVHPEDEHLRWPDASAVQGWWRLNAARFPAGTRHLCGRPANPQGAAAALREGFQRERGGAAIELARAGAMLFPVAAPASRQSHWMSRWNS